MLLIKIGLSLVFGYLIGIERENSGKAIGTRTISLICLGSTLFCLMSPNILNGDNELPHIDGVGVIRVDKTKSKYEYMLANNGEDFTFLNSVREAATNMVNWYYYLQSVQYEYKKFRKEYFKRGY